MIRQRITLERIAWSVTVFYGATPDDRDAMLGQLECFGADRRQLRRAASVVGEPDSSMTYTNMEKRQSIVVISQATCVDNVLRATVREACNVTAHATKHFGLERCDELFSYICGDLVSAMYGVAAQCTEEHPDEPEESQKLTFLGLVCYPDDSLWA